MSSQDFPPPDDSYPPPPPAEAPVQEESRGSMLVGSLIGFFGCSLAGLAGLGLGTLELLLLLPIVALGAGIALTVITSTRRTGIGVLIGFAIFLVVLAGTCVAWISTADFG